MFIHLILITKKKKGKKLSLLIFRILLVEWSKSFLHFCANGGPTTPLVFIVRIDKDQPKKKKTNKKTKKDFMEGGNLKNSLLDLDLEWQFNVLMDLP